MGQNAQIESLYVCDDERMKKNGIEKKAEHRLCPIYFVCNRWLLDWKSNTVAH